MSIKQFVGRKIGKVGNALKKNAPSILSWGAVIGVGLTAYFSARGAVKQVSDEAAFDWEEKTSVQKAFTLATNFGPAAAAGIGTSMCIVGSNALSKQQQMSLMSAYIAGDQAFKKYRKKVDEVLGEGSDKEIKEAIATDMLKYQPADRAIHVPKGCSDEDMLFYLDIPVYEDGTGLWFHSTLAYVKDCAAHLNRNFAMRGYADLYEYIQFLFDGENDEELGNGLGWSCGQGMEYGMSYIDFSYRLYESDDPDTPPYYQIYINWEPTADYMDY